MSRPGVQQRWYNCHAARASRTPHRQQQLSGGRNREFRPQQCDGPGYEGRGDACATERDRLALVSGKIDRTSKLQPGQIAGAGEPLFADSIPATNVPCLQAVLPGRAQVPADSPGTSRMFSAASSGWPIKTGPSISPTLISGLPRVRSSNRVSLTKSK